MSAFPGGIYEKVGLQTNVRASMFGAETDEAGVIDGVSGTGGQAAFNTKTPTYRVEAGQVLVFSTSLGKYVLTNDTSDADANGVATATAAETADADWTSKTITLAINGATIVVVSLAGGDDTDAEVVIALNGDAKFAANAIASTVANRVTVKSLRAGSDVYIKVTSSLSTAFGTNGAEGKGTDAKYRVLINTTNLVSPIDYTSEADGEGRMAKKGHFIEANLIGLTNEARATLVRQGTVFTG